MNRRTLKELTTGAVWLMPRLTAAERLNSDCEYKPGYPSATVVGKYSELIFEIQYNFSKRILLLIYLFAGLGEEFQRENNVN